MRRRRAIWLGILFALVVALVGWRVLEAAEPHFARKPLSFWLSQYVWASLTSERSEEARLAVRQIGTNAIPCLLTRLREKDSKVVVRIRELVFKQSLIKIHFKPAEDRNREGQAGFEILGADAKDAVPALIEIFEENISGPSQLWTALALGEIGPDAPGAIASLSRAATNSNVDVRISALFGLHRMRALPDRVIPVLTYSLRDTNIMVKITAIKSLGQLGPRASEAVPPLLDEATNVSSTLRVTAIWSLGKIHSQPDTVVPQLTACLGDATTTIRIVAACSLTNFGPTARPAIPALSRMLADPEPDVRSAASRALSTIQPTTTIRPDEE